MIDRSDSEFDIAIIGGGMVGASFACMLAQAGKDASCSSPPLRILVVESFALPDVPPSSANATRPAYQPSFDARSTALSFASKKIFSAMGLWNAMSAHLEPIHKIHVSEQGRWGSTLLDCAEEQMDSLGYVIENPWLGKLLFSRMQAEPTITLQCPARVSSLSYTQDHFTLSLQRGSEPGAEESGAELMTLQARLVVVADGVGSATARNLGIHYHEHDYQQSALIANLAFSKAHDNVAYERFTPTGPLALLPLQDEGGQHRSALIWTLPHAEAQLLLHCDEQEFLARLQRAFGFRLGHFERVGQRFVYPLRLVEVQEQIRRGLVVLGNAAHSLHPVAGQGFNLALRDCACLAELLLDQHAKAGELGDLSLLQRYLERQQQDQRYTTLFSDRLPKLFASTRPGSGLVRSAGLVSMDLLSPMKSSLVRFATGLGGREAKLDAELHNESR